jgi:hypothetical protein
VKKKLSLTAAIVLAFTVLFHSSVSAFDDIKGDPGETAIQALKARDIVNGMDDYTFNPEGNLTYAQGVRLLVKAFQLNIDPGIFPSEPKTEHYYSRIPNDSWYAKDFVIACLVGLPIRENVDPDAALTRETFADLLYQALLTTGDYAFIEMFILLGDADMVEPGYMTGIQTLLLSHIAELDRKQNFRPKDPVTRSDSAVWLHNTLQFMDKQIQ